jgi:hypothetical protein
LKPEWPQHWLYDGEKLVDYIREAASPASALKVFHLTTFPFLGEIFELRETLKNHPSGLNPNLFQKLTHTYRNIINAHIQKLHELQQVNLQDSSGVEIVVVMMHHNDTLSDFIRRHGSKFPEMHAICLEKYVPYCHR